MVMDGFGNGNCAVGNLKSVLVKDINVPTIFDFQKINADVRKSLCIFAEC